MADSIEQKLITAIVTQLALINGVSPYQTTIASGKVADSRPNWDQDDDLPAISVFQDTVTPEDRDDEGQKVYRKMPVIIRGFLERGTDASTARKLISDIMRAIRAAGEKWVTAGVALAHRTDEGPHGIEYAEGTYEITGVMLQIDIYYIANRLDMES